MTVYLLGSPTETGNDIYLEPQQVLDNASAGVAVYASIDAPSEHLVSFLGGDTPVAHLPYGDTQRSFADSLVQAEIKDLLPP